MALQSLGAAKDSKLVQRTLDLALNTELIRLQDIMYCIVNLTFDNPNIKETRPLVWKWMVEKWPVFEERYKTSASILGAIVRYCAKDLNDTERIKEVEAWVEKMGSKLDIIRRPINQVIERLKEQNAWISRDDEHVQAWAQSYLN